MTTTQLSRSFDYTLPVEFFGGFEDDFDIDAINDEVCEAINALLPEGVVLCRNGMVIADVELVDLASRIDFRELSDGIELEPILKRHLV